MDNHQYPQRTRLLFIASILALVSIPLIYTLVVDLKKLKAKKRIEMTLKKQLNREDLSRMTSFSYQQKKEKVLVRASVNTVSLFDRKTEHAIEEELKPGFVVPVELHLEQVLVASDMLPDNGIVPGLSPEPPRIETPAEIAARVGSLLGRAEKNLTSALAPFPVSDLRLGFGKTQEPLLVSARLGRDYPLSKDERLILARQLEQALELPVQLHVTVTPLLPPLRFTEQGAPDEATLKTLSVISQLPGSVAEYRFLLEQSGQRNIRQVNALKTWLVKEAGVDAALIKKRSVHSKTAEDAVVLRVVRK